MLNGVRIRGEMNKSRILILLLCLSGLIFIILEVLYKFNAISAVWLGVFVVLFSLGIGVAFLVLKILAAKEAVLSFWRIAGTLKAIDEDQYLSGRLKHLKSLLANKVELKDKEAFLHNAGRLYDERQAIKRQIMQRAEETIKLPLYASFYMFVFFCVPFCNVAFLRSFGK